MRVAGYRIYKTADGRHVRDGDPDAAYLAYSAFDEVPANVERELSTPVSRRVEQGDDGRFRSVPAKPRRGRPPGSKNVPKPNDK